MPVDSSRDLIILDRWRSRSLAFPKGNLTIPKRSPAELPGAVHFTKITTLPKFNSIAPEKLPKTQEERRKVFQSHHVSGANCLLNFGECKHWKSLTSQPMKRSGPIAVGVVSTRICFEFHTFWSREGLQC